MPWICESPCVRVDDVGVTLSDYRGGSGKGGLVPCNVYKL
jgi:hypothetical protein